MTTWNELKDYIRHNYRFKELDAGCIQLLLDANENRTQLVYVRYAPTRGGQEWVVIESPIGELAKVDVQAVLKRVESYICGGLAQFGSMLTLRHAVLLDGMDVNEFETPLHSVSDIADLLEGTVSFEDAY